MVLEKKINKDRKKCGGRTRTPARVERGEREEILSKNVGSPDANYNAKNRATTMFFKAQ